MAFGKADTGLIQADKASYGPDEMLGLAAGAGAVAKGVLDTSMKQMAGAAKAKRETKNKFAGAYAKGLNDNSGFANPVAEQWLTGEINRDSDIYASQAGNAVGQNQTITDSQSYSNQLYSGEGKIKAFREFHKGRQTRALNSDDTDGHFQDQLGAGNYELRRNSQGVVEWGVKNPDGYEGREEDDGYTWFTESTLPLGDEYNNEGGAAVLEVFTTEVNGRTDGYKNVSPDFTNKYKKKFTDMNMNYFDIKTLIAQDPEGDNIEGNDFHTAFVNGKLPNEYYEGINGDLMSEEEWTQLQIDNKMETGPMAPGGTYEEYKEEQMNAQKMDPKTLQSWLNGENMKGTRDYTGSSDRKEWIIDKFSKYMGEVTKEGYNLKQKNELEKQNRYFQLPGEDAAYTMDGVVPKDSKVIAAKKAETYKKFKFDSVLAVDYDENTVDFNALVGENSDFLKNIELIYTNEINNDKLKVDVDGDELTLKTELGGEFVVNFKEDKNGDPRSRQDQIALMKQMQGHLATLDAVDSELDRIGSNANEWSGPSGIRLPANEEVTEQRQMQSAATETETRNQRLTDLEAERGAYTTDSYMGNIVYTFEDGTTISEAELNMEPINLN